MKKLSKILLRKEVVAKLQGREMNHLIGGTGCTTSVTCGHETTNDCISGATDVTVYVDVPTFSHDDGSYCASASKWQCGDWCYGA